MGYRRGASTVLCAVCLLSTRHRRRLSNVHLAAFNPPRAPEHDTPTYPAAIRPCTQLSVVFFARDPERPVSLIAYLSSPVAPCRYTPFVPSRLAACHGTGS